MLKIKDNVDLKELEKFGAKISNIPPRTYDLSDSDMYVWEDTREIAFEFSYGTDIDKNLELLFDLIQAGLVEKVGGESE